LQKISAEISVDGSSIKDTDTNKYISTNSITPTTVQGKTHNLVDSSLNIYVASSPAATTYVK
jgi:hypothetical protein